MSVMPVSNGPRLGTLPSICRKNASCRDSTASIDDTDLTSRGSVTTRRSVRPMVAPMPTKVIMSASLKNYAVELTKKE